LGGHAREGPRALKPRDARTGTGSTVDLDLNGPAFIADPYPVYARLRDDAPVNHVAGLDVWLLSRHADVLGALRDPVTFSSDLGAIAKDLTVNPFNPAMRIPRPLAAVAARLPWSRVLLTSDPPEHNLLRRKIAKAFTPRMIATWEPRVREITERLVAELGAADPDGRADLVRDLASPLPTIVIAEMLGIPPERHDDFKHWSDNLVGGLVSGGSTLRAVTSAIEISVFFARIVRRCRADPGENLISLLVAGDGEDALTLRELVTFCVLLLVAGNETSTNLITNTMLALFDHPDVEQQLRADPTLAHRAVEETLRYDNPVQGLLRVTTKEVTIGRDTIPAGARVLLLIGSANRDPRHVEEADCFRLDRESNDLLGFGTGIHVCIGAPLARLEGRVALETLFRGIRCIIPAGQARRIHSPVLRGLRSLPVTVDRGTLSRPPNQQRGSESGHGPVRHTAGGMGWLLPFLSNGESRSRR